MWKARGNALTEGVRVTTVDMPPLRGRAFAAGKCVCTGRIVDRLQPGRELQLARGFTATFCPEIIPPRGSEEPGRLKRRNRSQRFRATYTFVST
jgi:hypothetical protein